MSNAFRNYANITQALEQANETKNQALQLREEAKEKADMTGKTLGELKSAITGKMALNKIYKNIKTRAEQKVKSVAEAKLKNLRDRINKGPADDSTEDDGDAGGNDSGSSGAKNEPTTTEDLQPEGPENTEPPSYDDMLSRSTQATEDRFNELFGESNEARGSALSDSEARGIMDRGLSRVSKFEDRVQNGDAEGSEVRAASRNAEGGIDEISSRRNTFDDDDLGEEDTGATYNRANGLNDEELGDLKSWWGAKNDAAGPDEIENLAQNFSSRVGNFTNRISNMRFNKPNTEYDDWDKPEDFNEDYDEWDKPEDFDDSGDTGKIISDTGKKILKKTGEDELAETGGEEAGLGVLDSIPFADIFGFLGGAILAGVEEHKMHKEERLEESQAGQGGQTGVTDQAGVGGE
tara:strand:- start:201 stop:1421 length:1221 start_codon:yes stop_codon:yes gene_type:complete